MRRSPFFNAARWTIGFVLTGTLLSHGEQRVGLAQTAAGSNSKSAQTILDDSAMRERVAAIIHETIKQGEQTVNGIRIWTYVPPSSEAIEELKGFGDLAIPVLEQYIWSENDSGARERWLAVRLLGILGGSRIVKPLEKIIRTYHSPGIRWETLRSLSSAPWDQAMPIIQWAAKTDPDPDVRKLAEDILRGHRPR